MMEEKQTLFFHKITTSNSHNTIRTIVDNDRSQWKKQVGKTLETISITPEDLQRMSKTQAKTFIKKALRTKYLEKTLAKRQTKSKLENLLRYKTTPIKIGTPPKYTRALTRNQCANIFTVRSRMMKVKCNYKSQYQSLQCRWCNATEENQEHVLTGCPKFSHLTEELNYSKIMANDIDNLKIEANKLQEILDIVRDHQG